MTAYSRPTISLSPLALPVLAAPDREGDVRALRIARVTFLVASTRGPCWGVERALRIAHETIDDFAGRRVFLTSAILHNPRVNAELEDRGVVLLDRHPESRATLGPGDVVLVPAFGVAPAVRRWLDGTGCLVVDTTCGSVVFVWKHVDRLVADGFTVVYHGRHGHEEATATLERLTRPGRPEHPFVIVENSRDAGVLVAYLDGRLDAEALVAALPRGLSPGFRPARDLARFGFANQTTMLASESLGIARDLEIAQSARFPGDPLDARFRVQDTICGATQERQEAVRGIIGAGPDLVLVVGGFDSSNTAHLAELAADAGVPVFHVEDAHDLLSHHAIRHRDPVTARVVTSERWLPAGEVRIGATSGASTPEANLRAVLERVGELSR